MSVENGEAKVAFTEPHARFDEMIVPGAIIDTQIERPSARVRGLEKGPDGGAIGRGRLPVIGQGNAEAGRRTEIIQSGQATAPRGNGRA